MVFISGGLEKSRMKKIQSIFSTNLPEPQIDLIVAAVALKIVECKLKQDMSNTLFCQRHILKDVVLVEQVPKPDLADIEQGNLNKEICNDNHLEVI